MSYVRVAVASALLISSPSVAAAESWILWESVEEHRFRPVDSPFPSQAACVTRGQARIAQYRQQDRFKKPGIVSDVTDDGLTFSVRWKVTTDHTGRAKDITVALAEYRQSLDKLLTLYEGNLAKALEQRDQRRNFYQRGIIGADEVERVENEVTTAQQKVDGTRREIAAADQATAEAKRQPTSTTKQVGFTALRYQCWPVGVNP